MTRKLPSVTLLRALFKYDPETGVLTRRGQGTKKLSNKVSISGVDYWCARVIWKLHVGEDPVFIDFADGDERNLRFTNLVNRISLSELRSSSRAHADSKTGVRGVFPNGKGGFRAELTLRGVRHRLGSYPSIKAAAAAQRRARARLTQG
jgi:hypothetical protein